jgi:tRNA nucleotidyltransferase (CCA-adding enzyme)
VTTRAAPELAEHARQLPGMDRVLDALEGMPPVYLVGGAVRDLLRARPSADVDLAVEGDAVRTARELAARLGGEATAHERFGTATVRAGALVLDLAATRAETYPAPGALPECSPAPLAQDLARRDFTVNAMALGLAGPDSGRLVDPREGEKDLRDGVVRVLHPASFVDDPTRMLRALRYEARLDAAMDAHTEGLALDAVRAGALGTVSAERVREELLALLAEAEAPSAVARMGALGIADALGLRGDAGFVAAAMLACADTGADRVLAGLAALLPDPAAAERLALPAGPRRIVMRAADRAPALREALASPLRASELHALLRDEPPEAIALALALGAPGEPVLRFVSELRHARLGISGDDLRAAGVPESAALGRALEETLRRKLDGELRGPEEELRVALALAREGV